MASSFAGMMESAVSRAVSILPELMSNLTWSHNTSTCLANDGSRSVNENLEDCVGQTLVLPGSMMSQQGFKTRKALYEGPIGCITTSNVWGQVYQVCACALEMGLN